MTALPKPVPPWGAPTAAALAALGPDPRGDGAARDLDGVGLPVAVTPRPDGTYRVTDRDGTAHAAPTAAAAALVAAALRALAPVPRPRPDPLPVWFAADLPVCALCGRAISRCGHPLFDPVTGRSNIAQPAAPPSPPAPPPRKLEFRAPPVYPSWPNPARAPAVATWCAVHPGFGPCPPGPAGRPPCPDRVATATWCPRHPGREACPPDADKRPCRQRRAAWECAAHEDGCTRAGCASRRRVYWCPAHGYACGATEASADGWVARCGAVARRLVERELCACRGASHELGCPIWQLQVQELRRRREAARLAAEAAAAAARRPPPARPVEPPPRPSPRNGWRLPGQAPLLGVGHVAPPAAPAATPGGESLPGPTPAR